MIRRPPRSTLFPYTDALPISGSDVQGGRRCQGLRRDPRVSREDSERDEDGPADRPRSKPESDDSPGARSEEHTSELQSRSDLVCRLLLEKKKNTTEQYITHNT